MDAVAISDKGEPEDNFRCQTCPQTFQNVDKLIDHQNEFGHLELKQTPIGPGYLCWKRGCNQYFKTGQALQVHFREIHASRKHMAVSDRHVYKYRCSQCSLAFKTMPKLQLHSQYHQIRAASKCNMCGRSFRSVSAMRKHVESTHMDTMSEEELEQYKQQMAALPPMIAGEASLDDDVSNVEFPPKLMRPDGTDDGDDGDDEDEEMPELDKTDKMNDADREQQMFEIYMNSTGMAESSYNDATRKYKCHKCKVGYTNPDYLTLHNKSGLHRKNVEKMSFAMEKFRDPNRPYKCDTCKESFTQKNILLVHYNSVSHLHKLKQVEGGETSVTSPAESPTCSNSSTVSPSNVSPSSSTANNNNNDPEKKPYRCNICKVAYSQSSTMDIHIRSVSHQTRTAKLHELALSGHVDLTQPLIEQPESTSTLNQHKKMLTEMLQQKQTLMATLPSLTNATGMKGLQLPLLPPTSSAAAVTSTSVAKPSAIMATKDSKDDRKMIDSQLELTCHRCAVQFSSPQDLVTHQQMHCIPQPHLSTPVIRGNRLVAKYQPQLQHSLLQNFGFECVMQYNENRQKIVKVEEIEEDAKEDIKDKEESIIKDDDEIVIVKTEDSEDEGNGEGSENEEPRKEPKDIKEEKAMPEIMKSKCPECNKQFSSIWVLKTHQEEVHNNVVPSKLIQEYSEKFKDDYAKTHPVDSRPPSTSVTPKSNTPTAPSIKQESSRDQSLTPAKSAAPSSSVENSAPSTPTTPIDLMAAQMMQMPMFGMMPMPLGMNMAPPLLPMMMPLGGDFALPGMPGMPPMMDPSMFAAAQQQAQQQQAAAAAAQAQQQKRARTRISDDQLKILRTYFDINNSPSEAQINEMAEKSNLPAKVIKHWFRNTLFKERQRNKDSPYNFSIPPSTPLNLEEYEKTGKVATPDIVHTDTKLVPETKVKEEKCKIEPVETPLEARQTPDRESIASQDGSIVSSTPSTSTSSTPALQIPPSAQSFMLNPSFSAAAASHQEIVSALKSAPFMTPPVITPDMGMSQSPMPDNYISQMQGGGSGPKRANRTRFSDYQIQVLQEFFDQNAYPKDDDLDHMSKMLNLNPRVIVVWFQNARQKARKNYENQPPVEVEEDNSKSPFQRTPGLNYQCKKCLTVFQRYYELIKHQKNHCFKDSPNSASPGNSNNSNSENNDRLSSRSMSPPTNFTSTSPLSAQSSNTPNSTPQKVIDIRPLTPKSDGAQNDELPSFKCEKCNLKFPRLDLWQEHQNIHTMNPSLFAAYAPDSAFAMLQSVAQHHIPGSKDDCTPDRTFGNKRKAEDEFDEEDDSNSSSEQQRDKRLRTTILPEQLDYLYQKYSQDCNPSRKQLDAISDEVGLKKRVVQVC